MDLREILQVDQRGIAERVSQWRYGVIECCGGRVRSIRGRWLPKLVSGFGVWWGSQVVHRYRAGDCCLLFYDQPWLQPDFLALKFLQSHAQCSLATIRAALQALDLIAELKGIDAIVTEVQNDRLTTPILTRFGFVRHLNHRSGRHYIRRFYGDYPQIVSPQR